MRKNVLALSIATMIGGLGFAGLASANVIIGTRPSASATPANNLLRTANATQFTLSPGGIGHQLITPYFNAQNGNGTVLHVVNTDTVNGKALKVRFRGASNSDDILDFYVLMSPTDVWTGIITQGSSGNATLTSADKSCTYPALSASGQPFVDNRLNQAWDASTRQNNTREGYVEMFVAADIPSNLVYTATANANSALYTAIKHVGNPAAAPCTLSALNAAFLTDKLNEAEAATVGFDTPTGQVAGSWYIINVPQSTTFSGDMTALRATNGVGGPNARGNYVVFPQTADPVTSTGLPETFTADPLLSGGSNAFRTKTAGGVTTTVQPTPLIAAAMYDFPDLSTPYLGVPASVANARASAASLTAQLAALSVSNQYATDPSISAKTDWTFSFPTRRYSVAYDYSATGATLKTVYSLVPAAGNQYFHDSNIVAETGAAQLCINLGSSALALYDREETGNTTGAVFSPGSIANTRFCGETSVLAFGDAGRSSLGASVARSTVTNGVFTNGWAFLNTTGVNGLGLPLIGSAFLKLTNPAATPGVSGNYGITWSHINR
jgi:hypothetical protein